MRLFRFRRNKYEPIFIRRNLGALLTMGALLLWAIYAHVAWMPHEHIGGLVGTLMSLPPTPTPDPLIEANTQLAFDNGYMRVELTSRAKEFEASRSKQAKIISTINHNLGGKLSNKGEFIFRASVANEVPPFLVVAIMAHETGAGKDKRSCLWTHNNVGGFFSGSRLKYYKTVEASIVEMCKNVKKYYIDRGLTTIERFGAVYCPVGINDNGTNKEWVPAVTRNYIKMMNEVGTL